MQNTLTKRTLFKRGKNKILYWTINAVEVHNGLYTQGVINIKDGQLGGKESLYTYEINNGKNIGKSNETTPFEQAKLEADSRYNAKKDEGYKSLADIELDVDPQEYIFNISKFTALLEDKLPKNNTDAKGNLKPMLAHPYPDNINKVTFPCFVQPKLDGVRCIAKIVFTPHSTQVELISRGGKLFALPSITKQIIATARKYKEHTGIVSNTIIFDGELYNPVLTFEQIVAGTKGNTNFIDKILYFIYDIVMDAPMWERYANLHHLEHVLTLDDEQAVPDTKDIYTVQTYEVKDSDGIEKHMQSFLKEKYEGLMVRLYNGLYEYKRSVNLLKYKEFDNTEFKITGFILGIRGIEDLIVSCVTDAGDQFNVKMSGDKESKNQIYASKADYIGKMLTVKHFGYTSDLLPRFPIGITIRDYE